MVALFQLLWVANSHPSGATAGEVVSGTHARRAVALVGLVVTKD